MKRALLCLVVMVSGIASAQRVAPDWASVDSRPTPAWWSDAKFGIFIHWGVYSVPAFAPKGEYAEWYWERLRAPGNASSARDQAIRQETRAFHARVYGNADYADFAPQFRAEFFDANRWADVLQRSGAKYVVMVSKHHDGFALWPSKEADASWGRPWNAVEIGPKRDLVGELSTAVRARGLEMGFYYS
jgi:alpha-L-fucosidase